jgi:spectinomycin phosphotransferase
MVARPASDKWEAIRNVRVTSCHLVGDVEESVRDWVGDDFGLSLLSMDEVDLGADDHARLWRAAGADGRRYAVKLTSGGTAAGLAVAAELARRGVPGVPAPVPARDGRLYTDHAGRRLSVVPWVSDRDAIAGMTREHWTAYGALLAAVHATPAPVPLPRDEHDPGRWTAIAHDVDARLRGEHADPLVRELDAVWRASTADRTALFELTERLAGRLRALEHELVLCHGDPHAYNLLLGDGPGRLWLIDWDDVLLAPRERDLIHVVGGVVGRPTPEQRSWFFEGYGPVELDPERLTYQLCLRALEDFAGFAAQVLDVAGPQPERERALRIVRIVLTKDEPGGIRAATESAGGPTRIRSYVERT